LKRLPEVIALLFLLLFFYVRLPSNPWNRVVNSDGKGYYAYLPAIFIYHDLEYRFAEAMEKKYYPKDGSMAKHFRFEFKGETVNKTFSGICLLWLPFFLIAHFLSYLFGFSTDGYSLLYQLSIGFSAIFYFWIGCRFLVRLLKSFQLSEPIVSIVLLGIAFGTNLFYYVALDPSLTHAYSFGLIAAFLYYVKRFSEQNNNHQLFYATILFGVILWVRPQNGFIAFAVPFICGSWAAFTAFLGALFSPLSRFVKLLLIFLPIVSMPLLLWYAQTGHFIVYSYGNERFVFSNPQFFNVLFSYQKGLFVYSPLVFVSLFGLIYFWRHHRFQFASLLFFFCIVTYIISSWEEWWYGCSYGHRVFIDFYSIVALLFGLLLTHAKRWKLLYKALLFLSCLLISLNLVQAYQHHTSIVPACHTNKNIYWKNFLKLTPTASVEIDSSLFKHVLLSKHNMESEISQWKNWSNTQSETMAFSGHFSSAINKSNPYGVAYTHAWENKKGKIVVQAMLYVHSDQFYPKLVIDFQFENGQSFDYALYDLDRYLQSNNWFEVSFAKNTPKSLPENAKVVVYFWNPESDEMLYVDDLTVSYVEPK
jgi:hypothetical protein